MKLFQQIQVTDTDTVSWTDKKGKTVNVNIARIGDSDNWAPALKSKKGNFFRIIEDNPKKEEK